MSDCMTQYPELYPEAQDDEEEGDGLNLSEISDNKSSSTDTKNTEDNKATTKS